MNFEEIWSAIAQDNIHGSAVGIIRRRILPEACCDLFLGIEKPAIRRIFLLRIAVANMPDAKLLPHARGFEVRLLTLPDDPPGQANVLLEQTNDTFRDIFATLALDIASHIAETKNQKTAVEKLLARLKRWQQCLERSGPDGLGEEAQHGLFGELWCMLHHLLPVVGTQAVVAWSGPAMAAQDFQLPSLAVEVKTTTAKEHHKFRITGEKQLESSAQLRVFLFHLALSGQRGTGTTLVDLVSQVRAVLEPTPLALTAFEDGLLAVGYLDLHATQYMQAGYLKREHHVFEVVADFPRIVGADLREGVGDVTYSVAVAACVPYQVKDNDFVRFLEACKA